MKQDDQVKLYAISMDPPEVSKSFAEKIGSDGKGPVNFPLLSDHRHAQFLLKNTLMAIEPE